MKSKLHFDLYCPTQVETLSQLIASLTEKRVAFKVAQLDPNRHEKVTLTITTEAWPNQL